MKKYQESVRSSAKSAKTAKMMKMRNQGTLCAIGFAS
jgi:hypothetical protein